VHAPEFEFEKKIDNIKTALTKYGIAYPVAVDNNLDTWGAFKNSYWPAHYLIDRNGQIVYTHFGEGHYDITENNIRYLLGIGGKLDETQKVKAFEKDQTPETYLGSARRNNIVEGDNPDTVVPLNHVSLNGRWKSQPEKITSRDSGATLRFHIKAKKVFLVMGTADGTPRKISLKLNGKSLGTQAGKDVSDDTVIIAGHALYELVNQMTFRSGLLEITAQSPGVEMYAFTFGD
jgi:hypothetical protein